MPARTVPPATILVVEDEPALADVVRRYLDHAGHLARTVRTGPTALDTAAALDPDVVVLDLGLPGLDGLEVLRRLREVSDCYVLITTARAEESDRLVGLLAGADDYLTKPFSIRELVARVETVLRRPRRGAAADVAAAEIHRIGRLEIDEAAKEVRLDGETVPLTPTERDLLTVLADHRGQALRRDQLLRAVGRVDGVGDDHLVDVHIANLRRKLGESAGEQRYVLTVRGIGYRLGGEER
ncbi:response regulator transcription factor [Brachybacterium saurashtrense]|uniref:DNA-binding response regulator n=1 Tax=Brachybacterium saurashtrense TaxID=556288 RepID=A0A345YLF3_9MICO|nr:response regulator transcription factor [Brachybacterium saurashtrense]AXK44755.1 DNA-binding response regulator [Brachybacterium saurashtrense]RRR23367.1 DNA-binding response regulator [Brachybacterium saurashtrense]